MSALTARAPIAWRIALTLVCLVGYVVRPAEAADAATRASVQAVYLSEGLTIDGQLNEAIYQKAPALTDFVQQEPREGQPGTERTEMWVFFDNRRLYIAARLWDSHPERIVVTEMRRDAGNDIFNNENIGIFIDTFGDHRSGYYFMTNPLGAMRDAHVIDVTHNNGEWNAVWYTRARRFEGGWAVEVAIPFKAVRYPRAGEQNWNIQLRRTVKWKNEHAFLTRVPAATSSFGIFWPDTAVPLVGLRTPPSGLNLEVKPYAIGRLTTDRLARPAVANDPSGDAGMDVKYGVTQGLTADFTYNTDFAQVEDDLQQVNLTRFGLFFPEKREFFIEGQGLFDFGGQTTTSTSGNAPRIFFSRQIGLSGGSPVPILGGARLTGKVGHLSVGMVDLQTDDATGIPTTNFGVVRLRHDIFGRSYVGMIATRRTPSEGNANTLVGVDSSIVSGLNVVNLYYANSNTPGRRGRSASYTGAYEYNADRYGAKLLRLAVEPNFNPEIGFLPRRDFTMTSGLLRFSPRMKRKGAVRKLTFQGTFERDTNSRHILESRLETGTFSTEFHRGDIVTATVQRDYEFLAAPFRIVPTVTIPAGGYQFTRNTLSYLLPATSRVRGTVQTSVGTFYGGTRTDLQYGGRVDVIKRVSLEPSVTINWASLPWGNFRTDLVSTRATLMFTPRSWLGGLVQYNSRTNTVSTNVRLRWEYIPGSDLFVVYSEGRDTSSLDRFAPLQTRTFVVKLTRMLKY